jgi:hypothetical protein
LTRANDVLASWCVSERKRQRRGDVVVIVRLYACTLLGVETFARSGIQ